MKPENVIIRRSSRKTISLQIMPDGSILIRCPAVMSDREALLFAESKTQWIRRHMPANPVLPPFSQAELETLTRQASSEIPARVEALSRQMGVTWSRITIRHQKTRWGSCSASGHLNFNCLLMLVPPEVLDYVIVHELSHRKQMNHSPAFWAEVGRVLPDYPVRRRWLKEHGSALIARLP